MGASFNLQEWVLSLFAALVAAYLYFIYVSNVQTATHEEGPGAIRRKQGSLFLRLFGGIVAVLGRLFSSLPIAKRREKLRRALLQAGSPGGLTPDEFQATIVISIVLGLVAGLIIDWCLESAPLFAIILCFVGVFYPGIWLSGAILKRRKAIFRALPDTLDILRLAVDAGLDLGSAMKVVVERGRRGPLLDELDAAQREMALGRTRKEALKSFAERIAMTEVNSFVLAVIQADQLGASIGPVLKTQSDVMRTRRWQMAEAVVNKMPMKMLGPLVLFIFPSSFIILFTPLLIQWMETK